MFDPRRLPAHAVNGLAVALGVGLIQLAIGAGGGMKAAQWALAGAVCTSLADVPNTVSRTWHRVTMAALLSFVAAAMVALLRPYPQALGAGVAGLGFVAMMTIAWGARAGPVSFAPILSLVFAMALPAGAAPVAEVLAWQAAGSAAYIAWALLSAAVLQRRYRVLAVEGALRAAAALFRARADLLAAAPAGGGAGDPAVALRDWVLGESLLAERLQAARDLVFAAPAGARADAQAAVVLHTIDLRDVLLASRLDVELLGRDDAGQRVVRRLASCLRQLSGALDAAADAVREGRPAADLAPLPAGELFDASDHAADDRRARLVPVLAMRLRELGQGTGRIQALLRGHAEPLPLTRAELQRFVAPEGWPLRALWAQLKWSSPVLRHALRTALALGCAYFIALALPWASHPHWLVLSVAVVLRGNLEQTLARRNARVLGTLLGCVAVLALSRVVSASALGLVFLAAVGTAHAYVVRRYWLAAGAATVMALLQSHMANPGSGFAVAERAADTLLGAGLAWAFSYVLPSWERRSLPGAVQRALAALRDYAGHALQLEPGDNVAQRLARRRAYDALGALAAALQRSAAEPPGVRVPVDAVAQLLDHGQRLMAHLSLVRLTLAQRSGSSAQAEPALAHARGELLASLNLRQPLAKAAADEAADALDPVEGEEPLLAQLPRSSPTLDLLPWLQRRLQVLVRDARQVRLAAAALRSHA